MPRIDIADNADTLQECAHVMVQLRPHLLPPEFVIRATRQMRDGYRVAALREDNRVLAVAGFRILENLAWGRFLYVDDLVTDEEARSEGYGSQLMDWLKDHARQNGCSQLHLDSGAQRYDAHRFYFRERLIIGGYHFAMNL